MGAGRGSSRRTSATATKAPSLLNTRAWTKHVKNAELEELTLEDYYLTEEWGRKQFPGKNWEDFCCQEEPQARTWRDLFLDAVAVGAVTLPAGLNSEELIFTVKREWDDFEEMFQYTANIAHVDYPEEVEVEKYTNAPEDYYPTYFGGEYRESAVSKEMLKTICKALQKMIDA